MINRNKKVKALVLSVLALLVLCLSIWSFGIGNPEITDDFDSMHIDYSHPFSAEVTNLENGKTDREKFLPRLNKYDVLGLMKVVFDSLGMTMVEDTNIYTKKVNFPVSVFDPESKIGFCWIDYFRFSEAPLAKSKTSSAIMKEGENEFLSTVDKGIELYFDDEEQFLNDIFGGNDIESEEYDVVSVENFPENNDFEIVGQAAFAMYFDSIEITGSRNNTFDTHRAFLRDNRMHIPVENQTFREWGLFSSKEDLRSDIITSMEEEVRRKLQELQSRYDQKEYLEFVFMNIRKQLEVEALSMKIQKSIVDEWKLSAADIIDEPARYFGFLKLVDRIGMNTPIHVFQEAFNAQVFEIILESDSKKWWKRSKALIALFDANTNPVLTSKVSYQILLADIMNNNHYSKWKKHYGSIEELGDIESISIEEIYSLDKLAYQRGIFIAPISLLDDRMIYDMEDDVHEAEMSNVRLEINETKDKKKRKELQEKLLELSKYRADNFALIRTEAKEKSLKILRSDMIKYIQWAREKAQNINAYAKA